MPRELRWVGSSRKDLRAMPKAVRADFGWELEEVAAGRVPPSAKALSGFGGSDVLELRAGEESGTYRAVYTVRFGDVVYILHTFQKKSTKGIATKKQDLALIEARLRAAKADYEKRKPHE